jgi:hypothetical protein
LTYNPIRLLTVRRQIQKNWNAKVSRDGKAQLTERARPAVMRPNSRSVIDALKGQIPGKTHRTFSTTTLSGRASAVTARETYHKDKMRTHLRAGFPHFEK